MSIPVPQGFLLAGVHCRIKRNPEKLDLSLIVSEEPATAAGVYTQNRVFAAPVALDSSRTPSDRIRTVVINSGVANACTGQRGFDDARKMAELAAVVCGAEPHQALVMSTGVIGEFLPMDKIEQGIAAATVKLGNSEACLLSAARGMMTTDTVEKVVGRTITIDGCDIQITGMAKGAGMIGPKMATMLGVVMTDASLSVENAQSLLTAAVQKSFNCISVDGHMSTNDTVLLLANGAAADEPLEGDALRQFAEALDDACIELAKKIPADGEGASHLITIDIEGCADDDDAHTIAETVANSPLVKTAITGADPNWGRIVSAAGYSSARFDPDKVSLRINGHLLYQDGAPVEFDRAAASVSIAESRDTHVELTFGEGDGKARFWTSDLTSEYVHLNADYHT